jgi:hypothetical protein
VTSSVPRLRSADRLVEHAEIPSFKITLPDKPKVLVLPGH